MPDGIEMFTFFKELINNGLFPIAACIVLFLQNKKFNDTLDKFKDSVSEAMSEQTKTLAVMSERLNDLEK